ncbi:MAG: dTDP-4-dehydrorhamnose reductase [Pseudohongiellaceae bacterium]
MKKILLMGANGQLGMSFRKCFEESDLANKWTLSVTDIDEVDLTNTESTIPFLATCAPSVILNCAAYTEVDKAEQEAELAKEINDDAVADISKWASTNRCRVVHISTDFVFDGRKKEPYLPSDQANPIGAYGKTKLAGEKHVLELGSNGVIVRTSWLYSEFCNNFVKTMTNLMSKKSELGIVSDQVGSPTSTHSLSQLLIKVIENDNFYGILHWCDGTSISWFDFAVEIQKQALTIGLLKKKIPLKPIKTEEYATSAVRPKYSVLDRTCSLEQLNVEITDWKDELKVVLSRMSDKDGG